MIPRELAALGDLPLELPHVDAEHAPTLRDYLLDLVRELWRAGDAFSAQRPLGVGDWQWPVYRALADAGYLRAAPDARALDDDPDAAAAAVREADALVDAYLRAALAGPPTGDA